MSRRDNGERKGEWASSRSLSSDQLDNVFSVLQAARRRYLLYYLYYKEDAVLSLEDVVEAVQRYEGASIEEDDLPSRQSVRTSLVHNHLPKLADVGVLDHDPRRGTVQFHGYLPLEEWLEWARRHELG